MSLQEYLQAHPTTTANGEWFFHTVLPHKYHRSIILPKPHLLGDFNSHDFSSQELIQASTSYIGFGLRFLIYQHKNFDFSQVDLNNYHIKDIAYLHDNIPFLEQVLNSEYYRGYSYFADGYFYSDTTLEYLISKGAASVVVNPKTPMESIHSRILELDNNNIDNRYEAITLAEGLAYRKEATRHLLGWALQVFSAENINNLDANVNDNFYNTYHKKLDRYMTARQTWAENIISHPNATEEIIEGGLKVMQSVSTKMLAIENPNISRKLLQKFSRSADLRIRTAALNKL